MTTVIALGTTDDVTTCECCGRTGLKKTVRLRYLDPDGGSDGEAFYGSQCASKAFGGTARKWTQAAENADYKRREAVERAREMVAFFDAQCKDGRGARANFNRMVTGYLNANRFLWEMKRSDVERMTVESLAYHLTVIETDGASAL